MKLYKSIICVVTVVSMASCDTTEDAYYVGDEPTDILSVSGEIFLNADGTAQTLEVTSIAYWDVTIDQTGNNFSFTTSTDHGNGTITVSSGTNYQGSSREAKLIVSARNFSKTVEIDLYQASLSCVMKPDSSYPVASESGGDVTLTFTSTVEWTFAVQPNDGTNDKGEISWLTFNPSLPGEGSRYAISAIATWSPNYTEEERVITLVLEATNENVMERLEANDKFTLRQEAGTAPKNLTISSSGVTYDSAVVTIGYQSVSAVKDCGVIVSEVDGREEDSIKISAGQDTYPISGPVEMALTGLDEGKIYVVVPYVENMVREVVAEGIETEFITRQHGASVTLNDVEVYETSVSVDFAVTSDFEINQATMVVYNADDTLNSERGLSLAGIFGVNDETKIQEFSISTENDLAPKTEYSLEIVLIAGSGEQVAVSERVAFTTKGLIPGGNDNIPPSE